MTRRNRLALGILGGLVGLLLALQTPVLQAARGQSWGVVVASVGRWFRIGSLQVTPSVEEQLTRLVADNARLRAENADYQRLRQQLGSLAFDDFRVVPAEIVATPLDPLHSQFVVNRGAVDGLTIGAPVVVFGSTLVGYITELNETSAVLQALSHPATSLPVELMGDELTGSGLVRGRTYTSVELSTVPRDVPLEVGQAVVTASQGTLVPMGLFVGTVQEVTSDEHEPYQGARLGLSYTLARLRAVQILVAP